MFTKNKLNKTKRTGILRRWFFTMILGLFAVAFFAVSIAYAQEAPADETHAYIAQIHAINPQLTASKVSGQAIFIIANGQLKITMVVKGVSPGMHLQHIHGFISVKAATCPPPDADKNGDGIIDLVETEPYAGTTLIPLNGDPVGLQIKSDTYPVAGRDGILIYEMSVPLDKLNAAIKKRYDINKLSLENRVIIIHGVSEGTSLPKTVKSLPGVSAYVTVPIACGEIKAL